MNTKMHIPIKTETCVAIIGGGIAGLAAAWYLQQQGKRYVLLEASSRYGGLLRSERYDGHTIEYGPDAFITRKPWAYDLAHEIGLGNQIIAVNNTPERIYILADGQLVPMPDGLRLLVPTDIPAFLESPLLSWGGKLRLLMDQFLPAREGDNDESLADFIVRRMGAEALDRIADPLLAGVYNADMHRQSILATFPQYRHLEQQHGSLIRGMIAAQENAPKSDKPALMSFKGGIGQFIDALVNKLTGTLHLNMPVEGISGGPGGYIVETDGGGRMVADSVIVATQANVTARLLRNVAPDAATGLSSIRYEGVGSMSLSFDAADVPHALDAYGIVIPASEGRFIDGMQWSSSKWAYRAPNGKVLLRVFFGGPHTREMLNCSEPELVAFIREELRQLLGITAKPNFSRLGTWRDAYPQYDVGHIDRVDAVMHSLPDGIHLAGNAYRGVGVPDTIKTAKAAAEAITQAVTAD